MKNISIKVDDQTHLKLMKKGYYNVLTTLYERFTTGLADELPDLMEITDKKQKQQEIEKFIEKLKKCIGADNDNS